MLRAAGPLAWLAALGAAPRGEESTSGVRYTEVMAAGEGGVFGYRIPGFVATNRSLHVFAEARQHTHTLGVCSDEGPHRMAYKRSTDRGRTFTPVRIVVDPKQVWGPQEAAGAVYDPTPVYDAVTGTLWVLFSYCPARYMSRPQVPWAFEMWAITSTDDGRHFSAPRNLSGIPTPGFPAGSPPGHWCPNGSKTWHCHGCNTDGWCNGWCQRTGGGGGNGIQLSAGAHAGRLLVPGYHSNCTGPGAVDLNEQSHLFYSDDHGQTWNMTAEFMPGSAEGSVVELFEPAVPNDAAAGNRLMYISRLDLTSAQMHCASPAAAHCVGRAYSNTSGLTWSATEDVGALLDPGCKNTVARVPSQRAVVHAGSASATKRTNISALFSFDSGQHWGQAQQLWMSPQAGGYTAVQALGSREVGVVFENLTDQLCSSIGLAVFEVSMAASPLAGDSLAGLRRHTGGAVLQAPARPSLRDASTLHIFVSPTRRSQARDSTELLGSEGRPHRSLRAARDAARAALQAGTLDVTVHLMSGTYSESLELGPEDSGAAGHPVVWRAHDARQGPVLVSGGLAIPAAAWRPWADGPAGGMQANLTALGLLDLGKMGSGR